MKLKNALSVVVALFTGVSAFGSGFALYEPSALSHAMGGALVGRAMDASANFNNPATLSDLTNINLTVGFVTEHPRCKVHVDNRHEEKLDPGLFWLPHFMASVPLPWGFTFGLGGDAEYGLGTKYGDNWSMNWSTTETTVQGYVLTPNLSYAITEDWSVGAGLRWLYFDFEQYSRPLFPGGGQLCNHLHGDNEFRSLGWQVGTRYKVFDNFAVGAVYKSQIDTTIKGRCSFDQDVPPIAESGAADADLKLPQSVTGGFNWDITDTVHFGAALSWTEWSTIDTLVFNLPAAPKQVELNWHDTWRFAVAPSWDFAEDWTWMLSYIYDMDCTDEHQESAMLPPADRHILGGGLTWRIGGGLECTLSYACIFMDGGKMTMPGPDEVDRTLKSSDGFCHAAGFSVTYRF